ncbi:MAG TPA: ABC transporter permease [Dehalococcoidia bacterium]|nr:ABC transporter permease [Dehalococcoidia bacterium]
MRPQEAIRVLLSSGPGKAGIIFFLALAAVSLYAIVAYPLDFGLRFWNNPAIWADNPRNAPPAWSNTFTHLRRVEHTTFRATEPAAVIPGAGVETRLYTFDLDYRFEESPAFTSFSLRHLTYYSRPPLITLSLARPDGREMLLYRHAVRGPDPGESPPVSRYVEAPLRVYLSGDDTVLWNIADFLGREFEMELPLSQLRGMVDEIAFGIPGGDGQGFRVLPGDYTITVAVKVYHPQDSISEVVFVLGGSVYGLMGTDTLGRDLAVGLLFGFPIALFIGLVTALLATTMGTLMGILSGYQGGKTDIFIQRFCDVLGNIPLLPILIFLIFVLGQKLMLVILILAAFGWPGLTILIRSMVLQLRSGQLVEATRALGASPWRIMLRHIFFQIAPFVLAQMIFFTPAAILAEAGLSFLGLGDPSIPTWGQILEFGFRTGAVYAGYWWWVLPPGLLIVLTAMTFVLLTLGMEPVVNPRLRS